MDDETLGPRDGISRRDAIKRSAVLGGALLWAVPTVRAVATPANAGSVPSQRCPVQVCKPGTCVQCAADAADCACATACLNQQSLPPGCVCDNISVVPGSCVELMA